MKKSTKKAKKNILEFIGSCRDLRPFDSNSKAGRLAAQMKDGKIQKSWLKIKDLKELGLM